MELDIFKLIGILEKYPDATYQFSGGDPLEYSCLQALNKLLASRGIKYKVFSNMTYALNEDQEEFLDCAESISVSLDSIIDKKYCDIRRPSDRLAFVNLISNIRHYSNKVTANVVITRHNVSELIAIALYCKMIGVKSRFYWLHTNMESEVLNKAFWAQTILTELSMMDIGDSNLEFAMNNIPTGEESEWVPCHVKKAHRVVDEQGREYTCCYAINDNGFDIDGQNEIKKLADQAENIYVKYKYCDHCSRYLKANKDWANLKDKQIFL